jgi:rfaE bifunctional protein kinase chain/domain
MPLHETSRKEIELIWAAAGAGKGVVFISGIFNTIHPGHTRLFRYAQEQGDFVVVGVLDDSVARGAIVTIDDRLMGVREMSCIDYAFVLRDSPAEFIAALQPSTVVKGLEHKNQINPEKAAVETYGGRLIFSSGETLFSSLDLLRRDVLQVNYNNIHPSQEFLARHNLSAASLGERLQAIQEKRVIVIGDTIMDEYITCDAVGLSREDPTVVVRPLSKDAFLGGAGIVSAHARSLGKYVNFFTVLGHDEQAEHALKLLANYRIEANALRDDTRATTHKIRYRAQDRTMLRVNTFSEIEISAALQNALYGAVEEKIADADLLIFSDFNYGILPQPLVERLTELANTHGIFVVADSQTSSQIGDISRFVNMTLITPTEHEARVALRDTTGGLAQVASALIEKAGCQNIILTLGAEGVFMQSRDRDKDRWLTDRLPAFNSLPRDPAGAGDALMVTASLAMASGASLWEAAYLGSVAAACQVSRLGNLPLTIEELSKEVARAGALAA